MLRVLFLFAHFLAVLAAASLLPVAFALGAGDEVSASAFFMTGSLSLFVSVSLILAYRGRETRLRQAERYILAVLLFTVLPIVAAAPLLLVFPEITLVDALFEMVSAITTTGGTVLARVEQLPTAIVFWRCLLQWFGGGLTILLAVLVLGPAGAGGLPAVDARMIEHGGQNERVRLYQTLSEIIPIYALTTLIAFALLMITGVEAFDALCLAMAALSTGGFVSRSTDFIEYMPMSSSWVFGIFMLVGASSILWQQALAQRRWQRVLLNRESLWLFVLTGVFGLIIAVVLFRAGGDSLATALTDGFVSAASLVSTTGVESRHGSYSLLPIAAVLMSLIIGGCAFSTAGGIKLFRAGAMSVQAYRELNRLVYPHGIRRARFGSQAYDMQIMKAIWSTMTAALMLLAVSMVVLTADGLMFEDAVLLSVAALTNTGPAYQSALAHAEPFRPIADLSSYSKVLLSVTMIMGRIEIVAIFSLLRPATWFR